MTAVHDFLMDPLTISGPATVLSEEGIESAYGSRSGCGSSTRSTAPGSSELGREDSGGACHAVAVR